MMGKIKTYVALGVLLVYVLASTGCAVVWFLAGAGAAATAITVSEDQKKD